MGEVQKLKRAAVFQPEKPTRTVSGPFFSPGVCISLLGQRSTRGRSGGPNESPRKIGVFRPLIPRHRPCTRANFDYLISIIMLEIQSRSFEIIHSMVICN